MCIHVYDDDEDDEDDDDDDDDNDSDDDNDELHIRCGCTYKHTYPPACLPACLPTTYLPTYLPTRSIPASRHACIMLVVQYRHESHSNTVRSYTGGIECHGPSSCGRKVFGYGSYIVVQLYTAAFGFRHGRGVLEIPQG